MCSVNLAERHSTPSDCEAERLGLKRLSLFGEILSLSGTARAIVIGQRSHDLTILELLRTCQALFSLTS